MKTAKPMRTERLIAWAASAAGREGEAEFARQEAIARAADLLRSGELVAFPTDTVYGVAAAVNQPKAVTQLYKVKDRPADKAIPILLAEVADLHFYVTQVSDWVQCLVARFWPGGLTLILPKSDAVSREVSSTPNVAVRLPGLPLTRQIITAVGTPLAVTSANRSGQLSPRTALEVIAQLGGRISAVVDGGSCPGGVPSTILDCTAAPPALLRVGAISVEALLEITPLR
jgi:L-threonylcarbamoyladenylate synthase